MACKEEHRLKSWYIKSRRTTGVGKSFAAEGKQEEEEEEEEEEEGEEVVLNAGEVLFIPSFTFHQVHPLSFSSSINIFTSTEYSDTFKALREVCGGYTRILFLFFFYLLEILYFDTLEDCRRGAPGDYPISTLSRGCTFLSYTIHADVLCIFDEFIIR